MDIESTELVNGGEGVSVSAAADALEESGLLDRVIAQEADDQPDEPGVDEGALPHLADAVDALNEGRQPETPPTADTPPTDAYPHDREPAADYAPQQPQQPDQFTAAAQQLQQHAVWLAEAEQLIGGQLQQLRDPSIRKQLEDLHGKERVLAEEMQLRGRLDGLKPHAQQVAQGFQQLGQYQQHAHAQAYQAHVDHIDKTVRARMGWSPAQLNEAVDDACSHAIQNGRCRDRQEFLDTLIKGGPELAVQVAESVEARREAQKAQKARDAAVKKAAKQVRAERAARQNEDGWVQTAGGRARVGSVEAAAAALAGMDL